jgi:hypothetical protein
LTFRPFWLNFVAMPRKLLVEYGGAIYHVLNRGGRRESIFQTDRGRVLFLETLAETRLKTSWQFEAQKLKPARRLHQETTITLQWITYRLHVGVASFLANLLRGAQRKR